MILSAQSIRNRCLPMIDGPSPMIAPFVAEKTLSSSGKSFGLSACSYDVRIAQDLVLGTLERPGNHPPRSLANTLEDFVMPDDVAAFVVDKSSYARVFVSAFNTLLDPGWRGNLTLELVNLGAEEVTYRAGDPVCQIVFHQLDRPTDRPYAGKYQNQPARPVGAISELADGHRVERAGDGAAPDYQDDLATRQNARRIADARTRWRTLGYLELSRELASLKHYAPESILVGPLEDAVAAARRDVLVKHGEVA